MQPGFQKGPELEMKTCGKPGSVHLPPVHSVISLVGMLILFPKNRLYSSVTLILTVVIPSIFQHLHPLWSAVGSGRESAATQHGL